MRSSDVVLLAAGFDLDTIVPIVIAIIVIASQVANAFRQVKKGLPPVVGQARQPRPAPVQQAPRPQVGRRPQEVDRALEDLLRRALGGEPPRPPEPPPRPKQRQQKQKSKKPAVEARPRLSSEVPGTSAGGSIARHVEEAFAHDLAHASPSGTARQATPVVAATQIGNLIAALRSPEDLRRLVIVREILDIPTHRW